MWSLDGVIKKEEFKRTVREVIDVYKKNSEEVNLKTFNKNVIDPIRLLFDTKVYNSSIENVIQNEIIRQKSKTISNAIGYFHQNLFKYIENCEVPKKGFDIIYHTKTGEKIFVELKNKHNTMNSAAAQHIYDNMELQLKKEKNSQCYLVEIISKKSKNEIWKITANGKKRENENIRRVSIDKFYEIVTGEKDVFFKICMELPKIIDEILNENIELNSGSEKVIQELLEKNSNLMKSLYLLAFDDYYGFNKIKKDTK